MKCADTLVITVAPRVIAIAAFSGTHLEYAQARTLRTDYESARRSTSRFVSWAVAAFAPRHIVLELPAARHGQRRADLQTVVRRRLAFSGATRTYVAPTAVARLLGADRETRAELHQFGRALWPAIRAPAALEAAALGFHVQLAAAMSEQ